MWKRLRLYSTSLNCICKSPPTVFIINCHQTTSCTLLWYYQYFFDWAKISLCFLSSYCIYSCCPKSPLSNKAVLSVCVCVFVCVCVSVCVCVCARGEREREKYFGALNYFFNFFLIQQVLISHQFYTHQCIHVNPNLPIHHTTTTTPQPLSPLGVHTFVLYICVSISALQTGSSVPFS